MEHVDIQALPTGSNKVKPTAKKVGNQIQIFCCRLLLRLTFLRERVKMRKIFRGRVKMRKAG